jgi:hypothetical protein
MLTHHDFSLRSMNGIAIVPSCPAGQFMPSGKSWRNQFMPIGNSFSPLFKGSLCVDGAYIGRFVNRPYEFYGSWFDIVGAIRESPLRIQRQLV